MRIKSLLAIGFLCSLSWAAQAQTQTQNQPAKLSRKETEELAAQVVDKFFPADGDKEWHQGKKYSCFDVYQVDRKGNPELIFAIYPEFPGRFVALKRRADGSYSAQDVAPTGFEPFSLSCGVGVEKINLRGDEVIEVSLGGASRGSGTFLFQSDGAQLTSIGPTTLERGTLLTEVRDGHFENIFGGDSFALVSLDHEHVEDGFYHKYESIYTLKNGRYVLKTHSTYSGEFRVDSGGTSSTSDEFSLAEKSKGPYAIQIANGDLDGSHRVSDVEISLNGKRLVSQGEINGQIGTYHVDIDGLKRTGNGLTVKMTGAPGASIYMVVEDKKPAAEADSSRQQ